MFEGGGLQTLKAGLAPLLKCETFAVCLRRHTQHEHKSLWRSWFREGFSAIPTVSINISFIRTFALDHTITSSFPSDVLRGSKINGSAPG